MKVLNNNVRNHELHIKKLKTYQKELIYVEVNGYGATQISSFCCQQVCVNRVFNLTLQGPNLKNTKGKAYPKSYNYLRPSDLI